MNVSTAAAVDVSVPECHNATRALRMALNANNMEAVVAEFSRLCREGVPTMEAYEVVVQACARIGDSETAMKILGYLKQRGIKPSSKIFTAVLRAAGRGPEGAPGLVRVLSQLERKHHMTSGKIQPSNEAFLEIARILLIKGGPQYAKPALVILGRLAGDRALEDEVAGLKLVAYAMMDEYELLEQSLASSVEIGTSFLFNAYATFALTRCAPSQNTLSRAVDRYQLLLKVIKAQSGSVRFPEDALLGAAVGRAILERLLDDYDTAWLLRMKTREVVYQLEIPLSLRDEWLYSLDESLLQVMRNRMLRTEVRDERRELHARWTTTWADFKRVPTAITPSVCESVISLGIVRAYDGLQSIRSVESTFDDIRQSGVIPERSTYNLLIGAWAEAPELPLSTRMTEASRVFEALQKAGYSPDTVSYANMFASCAPRIGEDFDDAALLILTYESEMLEQGISHDTESASALISSLFALRLYEEGRQRLVDMRLTGIPRSIKLYQAVFSHCAADRDPAGGAAMFAIRDLRFSMMREPEMVPDRETYAALIECCCRIEDYVVAFQLLMEMEEKLIVPPAQTYRSVLRMYEEAGELVREETDWIRERMRERGVSP
ncbi:hypothetical protein BC832DRAFT_539217 [Gaertneriomyces semiglobifer]|nr:hypothetical protein BC832DRAFT_539217 [Gaertneriomyces semiglobifer]